MPVRCAEKRRKGEILGGDNTIDPLRERPTRLHSIVECGGNGKTPLGVGPKNELCFPRYVGHSAHDEGSNSSNGLDLRNPNPNPRGMCSRVRQ